MRFEKERYLRLFHYRRPSSKTILGVTKAKKRLKRELGITALLKPFRWFGNQKCRLRRRVGYESEAGRMIRYGPPTPGGCMLVLVGGAILVSSAMTWLPA